MRENLYRNYAQRAGVRKLIRAKISDFTVVLISGAQRHWNARNLIQELRVESGCAIIFPHENFQISRSQGAWKFVRAKIYTNKVFTSWHHKFERFNTCSKQDVPQEIPSRFETWLSFLQRVELDLYAIRSIMRAGWGARPLNTTPNKPFDFFLFAPKGHLRLNFEPENSLIQLNPLIQFFLFQGGSSQAKL